MNVSELSNLVKWVTKEIEQTNIPQKYQALMSVIQLHTQPNQQKQPFENQKEDLFANLKNVPLDRLTKDQITFLSKLNILQSIGKDGINAIEDILFKNVIDVATSYKKLSELYQSLIQGIAKSNQIKSGLEGCLFEEEYELSGEILMRVSFTGKAAMSNITDFKSWGNNWYEIGRGISMAHGSAPEEIRIIGATKGSVIIELAVVASIATTVSGIILAALKVADKVLDIRKKAEEIRGMKLKNDKLAKEIEKEAEIEKKAGIDEICEIIIKKLKLKPESEGDKITALTKSVNNLVNFIENGGEVDFVIPEEKNDESEDDTTKSNHDFSELRVSFEEIRKLEYKLALIEHRE